MSISPKLLSEIVRYDPDTGKMFWKERPASYFGTHSSAFLWNAENVGKLIKAKVNNAGYQSIGVYSESILYHRAAWAIHYGVWPSADIDHINGQRSDNRICNLREASDSINQRNRVRSINNTSGYVGVSQNLSGTWSVNILKKHIGTFATFDEAVKARQEAQASTPGFTKRHGSLRVMNYGYKHLKIPRLERREREKAQRIAMKANGCKIYREPIGPELLLA